MKNTTKKKTCQENITTSKTKMITGFFRYILIIVFCEEINIGVNLVMLFIYSQIKKYELFFAVFFLVSCIIALAIGIYQAHKQNKSYEKTLLSKVISVYDEAKDEIERYSNVENEILSLRIGLKKDVARSNEIKIAYILKAEIAKEMGAVETISILGLLVTLLITATESSTIGIAVVCFFLVLTLVLAIIIIIILPKEKYIESVCEKIIQEAKEKC